jgi:hypothetical protein
VLHTDAIGRAEGVRKNGDPDGMIYPGAERDYKISIGLIVAGGAVAAAGVTWAIVNWARSGPDNQAALPRGVHFSGGLLPGGGALTLSGRF